MPTTIRCETTFREIAPARYMVTCKPHAVGTGAVHYLTAGMWRRTHLKDRCVTCGHAASSHGSIPVWEWHAEHPETGTNGTACATCKCASYR